MNPRSIRKMMSTKPGERHLMGLPYFDILANSKYCDMFEYKPFFKYESPQVMIDEKNNLIAL